MQNYYKGNFFFFTKEKHFTCTKSLDTGLIPPKKISFLIGLQKLHLLVFLDLSLSIRRPGY